MSLNSLGGSTLQCHNIIQRQITKNMVKDKAQWRTDRKSYMLYRTAQCSMTVTPQTQISRSGHSLTLNICKMAKDTATVTMEYE